MATRQHSIKVPVNFGNPADLVSATATVLGTPTIYIPENNSSAVTFKSVGLYMTYQDASTNTGVTSVTVNGSVQLGTAASSTVSITGTLTAAATLENKAGIFGPIDFTSYFVSNYGGAGTTSVVTAVSASITNTGGTGTNSRGVYGWFDLTYEYDDSEASRIHTICVPYESGTGNLTTTANTVFCTLPQLTGAGGLLNGYANPVIRHRWIEVKGNGGDGATTDFTLSYRFDAGGTSTLPTREMALNSATYNTYLIDASGLSTTATHTFQLWNSLASRWANVIVNEWITFEYDVAGTTSVVNYIEAPIEFESPIAGTTSAVSHLVRRTILIPEPGPIQTLNCSVELNWAAAAAATAQIRGGGQASYRGYTSVGATAAGQYSLQHRIDSGSAVASSFSLARGENNVDVYLYRSAGAMSNASGILKLLYTSSVASSGIDTHTRTIWPIAKQMDFTAVTDQSDTEALSIAETDYWITSAGLKYNIWYQSALASLMVQARVASGEGAGDGWRELYNDVYISDSVMSFSNWSVRARDEFKRYPNDVDSDRMDIETSRTYRTSLTTAGRYGTHWVASYHCITSSISGDITNSSGGTVYLNLYKSGSGTEYDLFDTTTRTGNGSYSFVVYDDTVDYYVAAYESDTLKGLSKQSTPTTGFDISLSAAGGGEFYF